MYPTLLKFGELQLHSWGVMLSLAVLAGLFLIHQEALHQGWDTNSLIDLVIVLILSGLIGGRLFYVVFYEPEYFRIHPLEIFMFWKAGLVFYGGLTGGIIGGIAFIRCRRLDFWSSADLVSPALALGYGIVRIGCFLNGCCFGKETNARWGVVFPNLGDHLFRHPTQVYLSLVGVFLSWLLYRILKHKVFHGQVFLTYMILYGIFRTAIEGLRDNLLVWGELTIAQVISLVLIVVASGLYYKMSSAGKLTLKEQP